MELHADPLLVCSPRPRSSAADEERRPRRDRRSATGDLELQWFLTELGYGGPGGGLGTPDGNYGPRTEAAVRRTQSILARNGFEVPIDGTFGRQSEAAVKAFQAKHELPANGVVDAAT